MARKGRDLERLISILERGLASSDLIIQSPDYLDDQVTGGKREVDVSIREKNKTESILMVLECRDRRMKDDVTWIEQLHTKAKDIGVPKVVAVSSSGFSGGARLKAKHYGIELRTIEEISNENLENWIIPSSLTSIVQYHSIVSMTLITDNSIFESVTIAFSPTTKYFRTGNILLSPNDFFNRIENVSSYWPSYSGIEHKVIKPFKFDLRKYNVEIEVNSNWVKIDGIELMVQLWSEEKHTPSDKMFTYSDEQGKLVGGSKFPIIISGREFNLIAHTYKDEKGQTVKFTLSQGKE